MDPTLLLTYHLNLTHTQKYLNPGIVSSADFVCADGSHWDITPELGPRGHEEGQGIHST